MFHKIRILSDMRHCADLFFLYPVDGGKTLFYVQNSNAVEQGCPTLLLGCHCPAEFSSNPSKRDQTS